MNPRRRPAPSAVVAVALAVAGAVVTVWRPLAADVTAVTELTRFPDDVLAAIDAYRSPRLVAVFAARVVTVAAAVAVLLVPAGRRLVDLLDRGDDRLWRRLVSSAAAAALVGLAVWLAVLPLAAWAGIVQDGAWGLRTAPASVWWRDRLLSGLVAVVPTALTAAAVTELVRRRPRTWPWHLTWLGTAGVAVVALVWPLWVAPLFVPTRPLSQGPVRATVVELLDEAGMGDARIEVAEASSRTTRMNAAVTGLGPTRRVVLHDTLLERPVDEVRAVVAHELAHRANRDIARGVLASAAGLLLGGLALARVLDPAIRRLWGDSRRTPARVAALAVCGVTVVQVLLDPLVLWQSRRVEAAADMASLELSRDPAAVVAIQRAFVVRDLSPPNPPAWQTVLLSSHPPAGERIRRAAAFAESAGIRLPDVADYLAAEEQAGRPWRRPE